MINFEEEAKLLEGQFEELKTLIEQKQQDITTLQQEIVGINSDMNRIQGAYAMIQKCIQVPEPQAAPETVD